MLGPPRLHEVKFCQHLCNTELKLRKYVRCVEDDKSKSSYGAWYISPSKWEKRSQHLNAFDSSETTDITKERLRYDSGIDNYYL